MIRAAIAATALLAAAAHLDAQTDSARRFVVIGCLSQANAKAPVLITDTRRTPPAVYRLDGDLKQLAWLVGQTVEIAGTISPGAGQQPPTLKVGSLTRISTTCIKR